MEVLWGILAVVALSLVGVVVLRVLLGSDRVPDLLERAAERLRARRRRRVGEPETLGRPIEQIALDVRRLGASYHGPHRGQSYAKQEAIRSAYERALLEACHALGVDDSFATLDPGLHRDLARGRAEFLLGEAGLVTRQRRA